MPTFHPASEISVAAFIGVCAAVIAFLIRGIAASARRDGANISRRVISVLFVAGLWLALCAAVVASGWNAQGPVHLMCFFATIIFVSAAAGMSPIGGWLSGASLG